MTNPPLKPAQEALRERATELAYKMYAGNHGLTIEGAKAEVESGDGDGDYFIAWRDGIEYALNAVDERPEIEGLDEAIQFAQQSIDENGNGPFGDFHLAKLLEAARAYAATPPKAADAKTVDLAKVSERIDQIIEDCANYPEGPLECSIVSVGLLKDIRAVLDTPADVAPGWSDDWTKAPRNGVPVELKDKAGHVHKLCWSTSYSIFGLGGCWTDGLCTMGDVIDFTYWRLPVTSDTPEVPHG